MGVFRQIKKIANKILAHADHEIRRVENLQGWSASAPRMSMREVLRHARSVGLKPATVIDVGAANGTEPLYETFPDAHHVLIEPLEEFETELQALAEDLHSAERHQMAISSSSGQITFHVRPDLFSSSAYIDKEENEPAKGVQRTVPAVTLDDLWREEGWREPFLIKADVEGGELDVIDGASEILKSTDYVILETTLFQAREETPTIVDVIQKMDERGFVPYEIFGPIYRPLDEALMILDVAFVGRNSFFRNDHYFATSEQRNELVETMSP